MTLPLPDHCPRCKADDFEAVAFDAKDGPAHDCHCNNCGYDWKQLVNQ